MSVIEEVVIFEKTYTGIPAEKQLYVDHLDIEPVSFGIASIPGKRVLETDILGREKIEYPYSLEFTGSSADDINRALNLGWAEDHADWLRAQTKARQFPNLGAGKYPEEIEATIWGFLDQQGNSDTSIYQITCKLTYWQD